MAISPGYPASYNNAPQSPVGQYTPISPSVGSMDPTMISTSYAASSHMNYSPTHLSPKGTSSINGFSTQVRVRGVRVRGVRVEGCEGGGG